MSMYNELALYYEAVNNSGDYDGLTAYLQRHINQSKVPVHLVLDLACGTGAVSRRLSRAGYEVIGVDCSEEMLAEAVRKNADLLIPPLYLCQQMQELDLYGTVDAAVCCMDSVNYVLNKRDLLRAFQRVSLFLVPKGRFILDIVTPFYLRGLSGSCFSADVDGGFISWQADFDGKSRLAAFQIDVFSEEQDGRYRRSTEEHLQRAYSPEELVEMLLRAGFSSVRQYGARKMSRPKKNEERIFLVAENSGKGKK